MDCLVLKLKESVNDDFLLKPDELLWKVISNESSTLDASLTTEPFTFTLLGSTGVFEANGATMITEPAGGWRQVNLKVTTGDGYIKVSDKNCVTNTISVSGISFNVEDFVYIGNCKNVSLKNSYGEISALANKIGSRLSTISLIGGSENNACYGDATGVFNAHHTASFAISGTKDISVNVNSLDFNAVGTKTKFALIGVSTDDFDIALLNGYKSLAVANVSGNVTGNISSLTNPEITYLQLNGTNVEGSVNDWLDALHAAGRTSGTLFLGLINSPLLKFDDAVISKDIQIAFTTSGWTKTN